jgi:hypothetical protein
LPSPAPYHVLTPPVVKDDGRIRPVATTPRSANIGARCHPRVVAVVFFLGVFASRLIGDTSLARP